MKNKILRSIKNFYPYLAIIAIVAILFLINYKPGTYLTGWDNLHPEFNFPENIKRSVFAVWQEYQGLGLLGGMAHASDLLRQVFLLTLSLVFPNELLRYIWTFLTLIIGGFGSFVLIKYALSKINNENKLIALTGAVFYLLNIGTIQTYFVPFEAFIGHFAALPWIIFASFIFFEKISVKTAIFVFLVFLLSSPSFYLPTLFLSSLLAITICLIPFFYKNFKTSLKKFVKLLSIIFLANAFWLLPFIFFTFTNSSVNLASKINQMATEGIFLQNKEYGNLFNVALLRGFLFGNVEPNLSGDFFYILAPWRNHFSNLLTVILGFTVFGAVFIGAFQTFKSKSKVALGFAFLFLFGFAMLATDTPPFSILNSFLRNHVPLFNQTFRFPYTKFLTLASLSYSIMLAFGIVWIGEFVKKTSIKRVLPLFFIFFVFIITLPAFQGDLFYQKERLRIPNEYFQTFDYFKKQNPDGRIANFPQYTYWGWNFYSWGYSGSGFLWYGIHQPIIDRAFDVWSRQDENYYWEINYAIYSKNPKLVESVINKYGINYLLIDKNIINPVSPKSLFTDDLERLISVIPAVKKDITFGNIEIYKVDLKEKPDKFVYIPKSLVSANNFAWNNTDNAYLENGDYSNTSNYNLFYPFASLFSGKNPSDISFSAKVTGNYIEFNAPLPEYKNSTKLRLPSLITENNTLPVNIILEKNSANIKIGLEVHPPEISLQTTEFGTKKIWSNTVYKPLFELPFASFPLTLDINGVSKYKINKPLGSKQTIGTASLSIEQNNSITLSDSSKNAILASTVSPDDLKNWFIQDQNFIALPFVPKDTKIILRIPKLNDKYLSLDIDLTKEIESGQTQVLNCDNFRKNYFSYLIKEEQMKKLLELSSKNASPCVAYYLSTLDHDSGYLLSIDSKNISGQSLHFWVLNEDEKTPALDTYLPTSRDEIRSTFVLPPMEKFGKAYSIHLENISIGNSTSGNQVSGLSIYSIPYYFLTNMRLENLDDEVNFANKPQILVSHPNQSLYVLSVSKSGSDFPLVLSQSFSSGWHAYSVSNNQPSIINRLFPFIFGKEIKNHFLVNNWENGWLVPYSAIEQSNNETIIILFLPQYLEYLGFILTIGTGLALFIDRRELSKFARYGAREKSTSKFSGSDRQI